MSKKMTAVEWLEEQIKTWGDLPRWMRDDIVDIVEKAKEMEKEQIKDAFDEAISLTGEWELTDSEKYYNETFKSE